MTAKTIADVIAELESIVKRSQQESDRAGYFAALYKNVTVAVAEKIKEGFFDDNERMEKLDVVFANRYIEAYHQYRSNTPCSLSWQQAFDATKQWKPMVIHHLLEGMNAHIGLDLGIAAAIVAPGPAIHSVQNDFNKINEILKGLVDEVKKDLFEMWPVSRMMAKWQMEKFQNEVAGFSMEIAREAAWKVALAYAPLNTSEAKAGFIMERDTKVAAFGSKLLNPGVLVNTVLSLARLFEFGSVSEKIRKLDEQ